MSHRVRNLDPVRNSMAFVACKLFRGCSLHMAEYEYPIVFEVQQFTWLSI